MNCTTAELMAVVLSRQLVAGDVVVTGTNALIPISACRVAGIMGAPGIVPMIGATGTLAPDCEAIPESGGDQDFVAGRATMGLMRGITDQVRGLADVIFLGGLQVDRKGRCNLCTVGDYAKPRLRGPGTIGLSMIASVKRTFMFFLHHDPRTFVEQVDFVSGEGLRSEGGLEIIVTPLGVFAPNRARNEIELRSIHPGVSFEQIQARTGFALSREGVDTTIAPNERELAALRSFAAGRALSRLELAA